MKGFSKPVLALAVLFLSGSAAAGPASKINMLQWQALKGGLIFTAVYLTGFAVSAVVVFGFARWRGWLPDELF